MEVSELTNVWEAEALTVAKESVQGPSRMAKDRRKAHILRANSNGEGEARVRKREQWFPQPLFIWMVLARHVSDVTFYPVKRCQARSCSIAWLG